ncbi:hypothetical protein [Sphingosinicella sp. LY1275]|uniref:hypothetical protein n=1 Tax=Sphingosinicella sp. LY1275 TaxID=3095379 RepID=UPI002ADEA602|nr:hypothetical protein [Sphingosinicella sp. LY1275]MEA1015578.1 hypothetical protein [Sphingosinicella sp. LY1275]
MSLAHQERRMVDIEIAKLDYELAKLDAAERLRFQGEFSQTMFRSLTLVNGGAIVALFTLVGAGAPGVNISALWLAFPAFATGLTFNLLSIAGAYFSQGWFMRSSISTTWNKQAEIHGLKGDYTELQQHEFAVGDRWQKGAAGAAIASLVAFIVGSALALAAVTT